MCAVGTNERVRVDFLNRAGSMSTLTWQNGALFSQIYLFFVVAGMRRLKKCCGDRSRLSRSFHPNSKFGHRSLIRHKPVISRNLSPAQPQFCVPTSLVVVLQQPHSNSEISRAIFDGQENSLPKRRETAVTKQKN